MSARLPFLAWLQRHRTLAWLLPTWLVARLAWRELEKDEDFMAYMALARQEEARGEFVPWLHREYWQ